ncbi:SDR family oxidoreductase [Flavobacteriaceae bacterium]|nr:SDR family oxidoreductase [Flavobacteriaceae bacterium]
MCLFSATKAALHAVSRGLSHLTKSTEVTVNTIVPGSTLTEGAQLFLEEKAKAQRLELKKVEQSFFEQERPNSLLQRFASVKEVASTVVYLCSPLSIATNGSVIKVDGGSSGGVL